MGPLLAVPAALVHGSIPHPDSTTTTLTHVSVSRFSLFVPFTCPIDSVAMSEKPEIQTQGQSPIPGAPIPAPAPALAGKEGKVGNVEIEEQAHHEHVEEISPELEALLHTDPLQGLSDDEVGRRRETFGRNELIEKKTHPLLKFLSYFTGAIAYLIEIAVIFAAVVGVSHGTCYFPLLVSFSFSCSVLLYSVEPKKPARFIWQLHYLFPCFPFHFSFDFIFRILFFPLHLLAVKCAEQEKNEKKKEREWLVHRIARFDQSRILWMYYSLTQCHVAMKVSTTSLPPSLPPAGCIATFTTSFTNTECYFLFLQCY